MLIMVNVVHVPKLHRVWLPLPLLFNYESVSSVKPGMHNTYIKLELFKPCHSDLACKHIMLIDYNAEQCSAFLQSLEIV